MTKVRDLKFYGNNVDKLVEDINPIQAELFLGGYCQSNEDYNCAYVTNITRYPRSPASKTDKPNEDIKTLGTILKDQNINSISNSRKIYTNGILVPGERSTVTICW